VLTLFTFINEAVFAFATTLSSATVISVTAATVLLTSTVVFLTVALALAVLLAVLESLVFSAGYFTMMHLL
jgi:hypothetical protein